MPYQAEPESTKRSINNITVFDTNFAMNVNHGLTKFMASD